MRRRAFPLAVILILSLVLAGCAANKGAALEQLKTENTGLKAENEELAKQLADLKRETGQTASSPVLKTAMAAAERLKGKDMAGLARYVHPEKGVRFTPYSHVSPSNDKVFTAEQLTPLLGSSQIYRWGVYDGSGEPIELNFRGYYDKFVYDVDFANPEIIGNNKIIGTGNSINNIAEAYPSGAFVEFHFTGFDPQYGGMDWRSLSLVFEKHNEIWFLVGIVHGQWTI